MKKPIIASLFAILTFVALWWLQPRIDSTSVATTESGLKITPSVKKQLKRGIASTAPVTNVEKFIPDQSPPDMQGKFSQQTEFEDNDLLRTVLSFEGRPVEQYRFVWTKDANGKTELVGGSLPEVAGVNGEFPPKSEGSQIVSAAIGPRAKILNFEEMWLVDDLGIMEPFYKVEIERKAKNKSGHEYWTVSVNTKKVIMSVEADRY